MNEKDTVTIPRDEYDALRAIETRVVLLERLEKENIARTLNDALAVLGVEKVDEDPFLSLSKQAEDDFYARKQNGD